MDEQSPEMERVSAAMRETMQLWIKDPGNEELKQHYKDLQAYYQRLFLDYHKGGDGVA